MKAKLALAVLLTLAGCRGKSANTLQGTWSTTNTSQWSHPPGQKLSFVFGTDGRFRYLGHWANGDTKLIDGGDDNPVHYTVVGDVITFTTKHGTWKEKYSISGGSLNLEIVERKSDPSWEGQKYVFETKEQ